jgi:NAD(P)H-dependent FMN reductase
MKILALVGSYRKGGTADFGVDEILAAARKCGAVTDKIYLSDYHLEYCTNCRACTQKEGGGHGRCVLDDDLEQILTAIDGADALVLASPVNVGTVTAVMKTFLERLVSFSYWPWGQPAPKTRNPVRSKRAVLVISSAAPGLITRWLTGTAGILRQGATFLGARTIGTLFIGLAARQPAQELSAGVRRKAAKLGKKLATKS